MTAALMSGAAPTDWRSTWGSGAIVLSEEESVIGPPHHFVAGERLLRDVRGKVISHAALTLRRSPVQSQRQSQRCSLRTRVPKGCVLCAESMCPPFCKRTDYPTEKTPQAGISQKIPKLAIGLLNDAQVHWPSGKYKN